MKLPLELAELFQESPKRMITMFTREDVEVIVRDCAQVCAARTDISSSSIAREGSICSRAILDRYGVA